MNKPVIVVGLGQLGRVLSDGFLRSGVPVVPVLRHQSISDTIKSTPQALAIVVAVGEDDLPEALSEVPREALDRVVLLQNELRPDQWRGRYPEQRSPSVLVVWFERKRDQPPVVLLPSVFFASESLSQDMQLVPRALSRLGVPCRIVNSPAELHEELVIKNLYILGLNLVGLKTGGTAGELLSEHRRSLDVVLDELLMIEGRLFESAGATGIGLHHDQIRQRLVEAIVADPDHGTRGRSAPRRLERTLAHARRLRLDVPHLESLEKAL